MLKKWLRQDPLANWGKLVDAIHSATLSSSSIATRGELQQIIRIVTNKFLCVGTVVSQLFQHVKRVYRQTRFDVGKETWPPEQPKEFTPVAFVYYEDQRNMKEATRITKAVHTGHISDIISVASGQPVAKHHQVDSHRSLREALQTSKVTKDIFDILVLFEQSGVPQTILIEGAPGIGKSFVLKHIAYKWAEGKVMMKFHLLLLVCLRDPSVQNLTSLHELLQLSLKHITNAQMDIVTCSHHVKQSGGKSVALLLDGYDEFPENLRENSLIADIINRLVIPECGLVVSSRPHASQNLRNRATLRVDILGFTEKEQEHFIQQSLKRQPHKIPQLTRYLQDHMAISSLCFTPFNMLVLLFLHKQGFVLPNNSTELYKLFICLTICRHLAKYGHTIPQPIKDLENLPDPCCKVIQQLSRLSLLALNNNQLIFSLEQIKSLCPQLEVVPEAINGFGLLQVVEHVDIFNITKTFNFIHFSIQEYLAAYYVINLPPDEEISILEKYFWSDVHYNMFNFYVTLTKGQRPSFKRFLCSGNSTTVIHNKFLRDKLQCFRLYRIFYEAGDSAMCQIVDGKITKKVISLMGTTLSSNNLEDIATFLTCSSQKNWKWLDLNSCHIQDYGLRLLHHSLHRSDITIEDIRLDNNDLSSSSDSLLNDIVLNCKVKVLNIGSNKAIGETQQFITTMLLDPSTSIEGLSMYYNNYSTGWATYLFCSLKKNKTLKVLGINGNKISDDVCEVICGALSVNNTLRELYMSSNPITAQASQLILDSLNNNNNTLEYLALPNYPEDFTKEIISLQQVVIKMRKNRGCDVKLEIVFGW